MILLVTQEDEFAKHMARFLAAKGYPVMLTFQGSEVPTLVTQGNPQLIIVNLYLRNPSGIGILRQLRAQGYVGKIIVLADYSTTTEVHRPFYDGVDQVLGQPLSLLHLLTAVRVAIGPSVKRKTA
ncbi:MAG: hypothetical protein NPIRA03_35550 [Nitrospirales bacterium]|nr:MAG: hypothetical protein NPIRA03_35550 [Nitrospirales bacterium]